MRSSFGAKVVVVRVAVAGVTTRGVRTVGANVEVVSVALVGVQEYELPAAPTVIVGANVEVVRLAVRGCSRRHVTTKRGGFVPGPRSYASIVRSRVVDEPPWMITDSALPAAQPARCTTVFTIVERSGESW